MKLSIQQVRQLGRDIAIRHPEGIGATAIAREIVAAHPEMVTADGEPNGTVRGGTWKRPIPGVEPYEASDFGNIRRNGHTLVPLRLPHGYLQFAPCTDGKQTRRYIHRAVALAWIGPCPEGKEVNHKNGVKTDNRPENLEYVTRGENMLHAHRTGIIPKKPSRRKPRVLKGGLQRGENHWMHRRPQDVLRGERCAWSKLSSETVRQIRTAVDSGERQSDIANRLGMSRAQVCRIVNRKRWAHL